MTPELYSIRMRAARGGAHEHGGRHISGAEKIVPQERIHDTLSQLYFRARNHELGRPDFINFTVEQLPEQNIETITSLPVYTIDCREHREGLAMAREVLALAGIKPAEINKGFHYLLSNKKNMRGAILMDINTGRRLEPDQSRGIRASRMDYHPETVQELSAVLTKLGLDNDHVREALCLATKVADIPGVVAELCWSDDPSYTAGYVAAKVLGYIRFPHLKQKGSSCGGRIFFIDPGPAQIPEIIKNLEQKPYIITGVGPVYGKMTLEEFKRSTVK